MPFYPIGSYNEAVNNDQRKSSKKIVIIRNAFRYDFGGGERMPVHLAHELQKYNYSAHIISRSPKLLDYATSLELKTVRGIWWARQDWSGIRILLTPIYFAWQLVLIFWYLYTFLKLHPNIVHAQSKDDFISATLAARILNIPVFWSDHADLKYVYQNLHVWYKNPIGKIVYLCGRLAKAIVLTSENDKRLIEEAIGTKLPNNYKIIYNGVFDSHRLQKNKPTGKDIIFVATSRLVTAKGIGELIEAFLILKKDHPNVKLWLFGDGPEKEKFEKQVAGDEDIVFKGFPKDTLEQAAQADVFVHPSYLEGFSISLIEAAMLGLPIIACRVGGNPEIVNSKNGILIPDRDVAALAKAMDTLASNKQLRTHLARQSRLTFEKDYNFENIVREKYLPLYE